MRLHGDETKQFFALLRAGLWGEEVDPALFSGVVNWGVIYSLAQMQTTIGVVADGINSLPQELMPKREVLMRFHSFVVRNAQAHSLINERLGEVVAKISEVGRVPILLKGQGVASCYLEPEKRQCGDIDLYIGEEYFSVACELISHWVDSNGEPMVSNIKYGRRDMVFVYRGVTVELHHTALTLDNILREAKMQRWSYRMLHQREANVVNIGGQSILTPPTNFDALYIFYHMWYHFIGGGVGLRQLCDWARYLYVHHREIDTEELEADLRSFKMLAVWRAFGGLLVEYLGMDSSKFPLYDSTISKGRIAAIASQIIREGNFGFHDPVLSKRPKGYITGKLWRGYYISIRNLSVFRIFPAKTLASFPYFIYHGVVAVFKGR